MRFFMGLGFKKSVVRKIPDIDVAFSEEIDAFQSSKLRAGETAREVG